ncbi:hypothetical protein MBLNU459_g3346t1 [Dothideomycetes sp. NU459]
MAANEPTVFDHVEGHILDTMSTSTSDDEYFQPSLRSLVGRIDVPAEHDAQSIVSVNTVSDAETVSDQPEGVEMLSDSYDSFTQEEVSEAKGQDGAVETEPIQFDRDDEDELEHSTRSDHTLRPSANGIQSPVPSDSDSTNTSRILHTDKDSVNSYVFASRSTTDQGTRTPPVFEWVVAGLSQTDHCYKAPDRAIRVMLLADVDTNRAVRLAIVAKLMSAITQTSIDPQDVRVRYPTDFRSEHSSASVRYRAVNSKTSSPLSVILLHAVEADLDKRLIVLKGGNVLRMAENPRQDFAVLYHTSHSADDATSDSSFPNASAGIDTALALLAHKTPVIELCANDGQLSTYHSLVCSHGREREFLHLRPVPTRSLEGEDDSREVSMQDLHPRPVPLPRFVQIPNQDLGCHLAFISKQKASSKQAATGKQEPTGIKENITTAPAAPSTPSLTEKLAAKWWIIAMLLPLIVTSFFTAQWTLQKETLDAPGDLALRRSLLQAEVDRWGMQDVNASSVLRYPTTTVISAGTTTSQVTFPTAMDVVVNKADQLFVSLPFNYRLPYSLGVLKNGRKLRVNATTLPGLVTVVFLEPEEANGRISVNVVTSNRPHRINETVQVDLGNRLLQRATYEKAANMVQQTVQRDVSEVHSAAVAFQNAMKTGVCSAANASASRMIAVRDGMFANALGAAHRLSENYKLTANTTARFAHDAGKALKFAQNEAVQDVMRMGVLVRNATSSVGAFLRNRVPGKEDFVRARKNSLKLRAKLQGKSAAPKQDPVRRFQYAFTKADVTEFRSRFTQQFRSAFKQLKSLPALWKSQVSPAASPQSATEKAAKKFSATAKEVPAGSDTKTSKCSQRKNKKAGA